MADSSESIFVEEDGMAVIHKNVKIDGNLDVTTQITTSDFKVLGSNHLPVLTTSEDVISFRKACEFTKPVQFNNGRTLIGIETTYNSAYVGSPTIQAGERLVVGDSLFKIDSRSRKIIADTFKMVLARLDVDNITAKREDAININTKYLKVEDEFIGNKIYADTIKVNKLFLDSVGSRSMTTSESLTTKDLIVGGTAKVQNDITIMGKGSANGAALTVNGGYIVANKGIVSHTGNNRFQTMEIMGSGVDHDVCFKIGKFVDSFIEGDVTLSNSKLILDQSKLITDDVIVTPLSEVHSDEPLSGVRMTTAGDWEIYKDGMIVEVDVPEAPTEDAGYDPVAVVQDAIQRNASNYASANEDVKSIINPITYMMEKDNPNIPKRFNVKTGVYRMDSNGHALFREVVGEKGKFSEIEAYSFKVNNLGVDKLVTTGVASNVVDTDQLLKSRGIAEFDGAMNINADVFLEGESKVNVASGASMTFQDGSSLKLKNGAKFEMGTDTTVKMAGDMELDISKLVFVDSTTNRRFKISFRDAHACEGGGIVMDYSEVQESESTTTNREVANQTALDAKELDAKLKSLGI